MPPLNLRPAIEALLFSSDQPLSLSLLCEALETGPDEVAAASLDALGGGRVVVTPGLPNKAFVTATSLVPRGVLRRVAGLVMSRRGR